MSQPVRHEDIVSALKQAGLKPGDTVLIHSSLSKLGMIEGIDRNDRQAFLESVFNAFKEALDIPRGTLVVPTFTHEYARSGRPFIYEDSPSEVGAFTEYVRRLPGALRSVHPVNSFSAIGNGASGICGGAGMSCYGHGSVFDRLIGRDAKMMFFGASMYHMTLKHHMEHVAGLPYVYHKAYFTPAFKNGKPLPLPFLACVRYLNGKVNNNDCSGFRAHLEAKGMIRRAVAGGAEILCMSMKDAFDEALLLLQENPCYFLKEPYYEIR